MIRPSRLAPLALMLAVPLAFSGCKPHHARASAVSAESHAPGTTLASSAAPCSAYPTGSPGVIRTFCSGKAKITLTVDGVDHGLEGGDCSTSGGVFSLNLGVVSGPDLAGPRPDYVGLTTTTASGPFANAVLAIDINGKGYAVTSNTGQIGPNGGSFEGQARGGGPRFKASFSC